MITRAGLASHLPIDTSRNQSSRQGCTDQRVTILAELKRALLRLSRTYLKIA